VTLKLALFDCDGVLVDSEPVAGEIASAALSELRWHLTPQDCVDRFTGMSLSDILPMVRAEVGHVPESWLKDLAARLLVALRDDLAPMDGAIEMLHATNALPLPWRVASNSNRREMEAKFAVTGLAPLIGDRFHSADEVPRAKPAPDLFLAAAAAGATDPRHCMVIEDSLPGIQAALAAGMMCVAFSPRRQPHIVAAGAHHLVTHLSDLPALFRTHMA
jgi:HAD superfamily hydrolase (TIGR01509 family)